VQLPVTAYIGEAGSSVMTGHVTAANVGQNALSIGMCGGLASQLATLCVYQQLSGATAREDGVGNNQQSGDEFFFAVILT
jgi:hypothetical protein